MRELSLFTGVGGGLLASQLLGWQTVGYVEFNPYCQQVIAQRIEDGVFDKAPIFGDIRAFLGEGFARSYEGVVDVVSAGFPCQPYSQAGKQKGGADERNMWPETIAVIRAVRPEVVWLENVPGLLANEYSKQIFADLAQIFPDIRGGCVGNTECGSGICNSERLWIIASKTNGSVLESVDFSKYQLSDPKESFRRQYSGAIGEMLSQDDYTELKRDSDAVAIGMEQLKAIGNGQIPYLAAVALAELGRGLPMTFHGNQVPNVGHVPGGENG